ncbi:MAG: glycerol-3-phosphate 1-O-acyltransferase PlsY [bacterium]
MVIRFILWPIAGFLIGGIPSGLLIGKLLGGPDVRRSGSRNIGATNVYRVLGAAPALLTLAGDLLKGYVPLLVLGSITPHPWLIACTGLAAIAGHDFSPYLRFKGGKGVATSLGVFLYMSPVATLVCVGVWVLVVALVRIVSIASIGTAIVLPVMVWALEYPLPILYAAIIACILLIARHKGNIKRLCRGEEKRLGRSRSEEKQQAT